MDNIELDDPRPFTLEALKLCWAPWWKEFRKDNPDARLQEPFLLLREVVSRFGGAIWVHTTDDGHWGTFYKATEKLAARSINRWQSK